ncbi:gastrin/cholecystokinin type B receptor-like [Pomacea canaliculata]|nr:gastrin/cholecystokinin type B receptor-like [Pomacea canaliculata]
MTQPWTLATDIVTELTQVKIAQMINRIYIPLCVSVGVVGNFLCFVTLIFSNLRRTATCIYMAAIAVLDSIILVLALCIMLRSELGDTRLYLGSDWACGAHYFLFYFSIHFDVLLLLAMTFDRYVVVRFPFKAQRLSTPRSAFVAIVGTGLFSLALNLQILFTRRLQPSGDDFTSLKCWYPDPDVEHFMMKIYTWIDAAIYSFVPFCTLFVVNLLIIAQLQKSREFTQQFVHRGQMQYGNNSHRVETDNSMYTIDSDVNTWDSPDFGKERTAKPPGGTSFSSIPSPSSAATTTTMSKVLNPTSAATTNVTAMLLLVTFTFLLLTSPIVIILLFPALLLASQHPTEKATAQLAHAVVDNLMYTNHAVNFLLYCISGRRFRLECKRLVVRFFNCSLKG